MIEAALESASRKKVLFLGEEIEDVYHYGKLQGRPLKEAIVCIRYQRTETFQGGVVAAANHARDFCQTVHVASTHRVRKDRFIEESNHRKLFEVYAGEQGLAAPAYPDFGDYDAVVVTDYGHGMFDTALIERLSDARFLAVNVQTNSGNYGFNLATKYPYADYLCMDEVEARLATQNRDGPIEHSVGALGHISPRVVVTLGKQGAIGTGGVRVPVVPNAISIDAVGAGDAFFAITALMADTLSMPDLLRVGNAAGAIKCGFIGHRHHVTKQDLKKWLAK